MSDEGKLDAEEGSPRRPESARQLLSTGGLLLAVLAILGLGAALAVDPSTAQQPPPRTEPAAPPPALPAAPIAELDEPPQTVEPKPAPVEPAPEETSPLASRATNDARRLAKSGRAYTLQLLVGCKEETVERYLGRSDSSSIYLLPATVKGQSCFRVTFGSYASPQEAAAAVSRVPAELRSGVDAPSPKKIADLVL